MAIVEAPEHLVLSNYIENYHGHVRVDRLLFIAERCPSLQVEAYQHAIADIKANSRDVNRYLEVLRKMNAALAAHGKSVEPTDSTWVEDTRRDTKQLFEVRNAELSNYLNNMIKESIRIGLNDLGDLHYACGDLNNAQKNYA
ncbi:hypothetical protein THASP1DRAFT_31328, partial [Thamnocephalis sphaerospora]